MFLDFSHDMSQVEFRGYQLTSKVGDPLREFPCDAISDVKIHYGIIMLLFGEKLATCRQFLGLSNEVKPMATENLSWIASPEDELLR